MAMRNSYNPTTEVYYGLCHGYAPDPGDYRRSLWEKVDLPDGPTTWDELLAGGGRIKHEQGIQMGLGMSNEIDSNMAAQTLIWANGGAIQDENENVIINSPETIAAVEYMAQLFKTAMTPEVFGWNAASNNQLLVAGSASYILNSISAYRTAQKDQPEVGADIFFRTPLTGPGRAGGGTGPRPRRLHLDDPQLRAVPRHRQRVPHAPGRQLRAGRLEQSELYNFPAWPSTVPESRELARYRSIRLGAGGQARRCSRPPTTGRPTSATPVRPTRRWARSSPCPSCRT